MITNVDLDFFAILAAVLLTLLTLLLKRWNNGQKYIVIKKFTDFLYVNLFYNFYIRYILESYLMGTICCLLNIYYVS